MLEEELRAEIEAHRARYEHPAAASVEALHAVQRRHGWVSDERLREVAALLGMDATELDAVASFYNLLYRRPVGRNVVLVCDSASCFLMGCKAVMAELELLLGVGLAETTPDGDFTVLPMCCLGDCDHAPVLMVGEELHRDLEPSQLSSLLDRYRSP